MYQNHNFAMAVNRNESENIKFPMLVEKWLCVRISKLSIGPRGKISQRPHNIFRDPGPKVPVPESPVQQYLIWYGACRPGGNYWDYFPDTLPLSQVTEISWTIGYLEISSTGTTELQWLGKAERIPRVITAVMATRRLDLLMGLLPDM